MGDAAHYMEPHLGQVTNTTFEDIWVLSACLANYDDLAEALAHYQKIRIERATILQYRSLFSAAQMHNLFLSPKRFFESFESASEQAKLRQKVFSNWLYQYSLPSYLSK